MDAVVARGEVGSCLAKRGICSVQPIPHGSNAIVYSLPEAAFQWSLRGEQANDAGAAVVLAANTGVQRLVSRVRPCTHTGDIGRETPADEHRSSGAGRSC